MSGIRISEFKKPATIIVDQAKVESAYGPKSSIQLETLASSFSKSGFTVEVKGLSRDSLLNGLFCVVPIQMRWRNGNAAKILPNQYPELQPHVWNIKGAGQTEVMTGGHENARVTGDNNFVAAPLLFSYDNICVRPNPFKCIRNATLSINGSSFSTRTDAYNTAMSKLFADGRVEPITGAAYERYPYSNSGYRDRVNYQEGWFERCRSESSQGKVVMVHYAAGTHQIDDLVIQYDVKFPIWFGPFTHLGFPGLSGFDGQTVSSLPYCNDIVFECTFTDNVIMDAFACSDDSVDSALSVANPAWQSLAHSYGTDFMPDSHGMWANCQTSGSKLAFADGFDCALLQPRLCYTFSEPDPDKMDIAPIYTLPSYRLITYESRETAAAIADLSSNTLASFKFPYIRLSNISSLYIVHAEPARVAGAAGAIAGRKGRLDGGYNTKQMGMACANRTCPIKWDTVRVSMSTSSSVLSNFLDNYVTPQNQFELFKKYSGNAMALTYEQWKESSQMLIFSAEELCGIGAFANSFQSLTLSVEFSCYRDATDTKLQMVDFLKLQNAAAPLRGYIGKNGNKGANWPQTLIGRLICLEPELVSISEGAVSVEQVKLSQAEIHQQLMGGAPEIEDAPKLDELAR